MSAVVRDVSVEEQRSALPKNLSYEENYHQKYYYPKVALQNMERREGSRFAKLGRKPDIKSDNIVNDNTSKPVRTPSLDSETLGSEEDFRASSVLSDSDTAYSEDYTVMTEGGSSGSRTPPQSPDSDDFSDRASVSTLGNGDDLGACRTSDAYEDDEDAALSELAKRILGRSGSDDQLAPRIQLDMDESQLADPLPSPDQDIPEWEEPKAGSHVSPGDDSNRGAFFEDREFDFLKTERPRRSTSLKTYKTPPGTPSRKKGVRFADALGLDLESVRHILNLDSPPKIPDYAIKDLQVGLEDEHKTEGARYLSALFSQPAGRPDFLMRVIEGKVCLENCLVDDKSMTITGTVRVANVSYHKHVTIRTTLNNWLTFEDVPATYVAGSHDGTTDRFSFTVTIPCYFSVGSRLEFCIRYISGGEYWDNNYGSNYSVICYAKNVPVTAQSDNSWLHFL